MRPYYTGLSPPDRALQKTYILGKILCRIINMTFETEHFDFSFHSSAVSYLYLNIQNQRWDVERQRTDHVFIKIMIISCKGAE